MFKLPIRSVCYAYALYSFRKGLSLIFLSTLTYANVLHNFFIRWLKRWLKRCSVTGPLEANLETFAILSLICLLLPETTL